MIRSLFAIALLCAPAAGQDTPESADKVADLSDALHPRVKMTTSMGDIILLLDADKAPETVLNFVKYARDGHYDNTIFHRVINGFMIQGGGFTGDLVQKPTRAGIKNEWRNGLQNARGTIAMARLGGKPDSATAQFFINVVGNSNLDRPQQDGAAYAVFGKVVDGLEVVDAIKVVATEKKGAHAHVPVEPVVIKSVTVVSDFDEAVVRQTLVDAAAREAALFDATVAEIEEETHKRFEKTESGLLYMVIEEGTGPSPTLDDRVEVHYTGYFLNGQKFHSSHDGNQPLSTKVTGLIKGWQEGLVKMKVGGKSKLIIPYHLAYGERGRSGIPPKSDLHFDVELLSIE